MNKGLNFDNYGTAFLTLYVMLTFEGWQEWVYSDWLSIKPLFAPTVHDCTISVCKLLLGLDLNTLFHVMELELPYTHVTNLLSKKSLYLLYSPANVWSCVRLSVSHQKMLLLLIHISLVSVSTPVRYCTHTLILLIHITALILLIHISLVSVSTPVRYCTHTLISAYHR